MPAHKQADPRYLTPQWRRFRVAILQRDKFRCVICGADVSAAGAARIDHIRPLSQGGAMFDPGNVRTLCGSRKLGGNNCDAQSHRERARGGGGKREERFIIRGADAAGWPLWRKGQ